MCKSYGLYFVACEHKEVRPNELFACGKYRLPCETFKTGYISYDGYCASCLREPSKLQNIAATSRYSEDLDREDEPRIRRLLDLAESLDIKFLFLGATQRESGIWHWYHSNSVHVSPNRATDNYFTGTGGITRLNEKDGQCVLTLQKEIHSYILNPNTPDLTASELRLYVNLRDAGIGFTIVKEVHVDRLTTSKIQTRIDNILKPITTLNDDEDKDCPICLELLRLHTPYNRITLLLVARNQRRAC